MRRKGKKKKKETAKNSRTTSKLALCVTALTKRSRDRFSGGCLCRFCITYYLVVIDLAFPLSSCNLQSRIVFSPEMPASTGDPFDLPLAKRRKRAPNEDDNSQEKSRGGSRIFAPFRVSRQPADFPSFLLTLVGSRRWASYHRHRFHLHVCVWANRPFK